MPSQLDNLVRIGQLKAEAATQAELDGLLRSGAARITDAENTQLSLESRFDLAYAAHAFSLAALRHHGYRSDNRFLVFQLLQHTLGLSARSAVARERAAGFGAVLVADHAEVELGGLVAGVAGEDGLPFGDRVVGPAEREQGDAEVDAGGGVVGADALGVLELGDGGVVDAHVAVHVAEADAEIGEVGAEVERL